MFKPALSTISCQLIFSGVDRWTASKQRMNYVFMYVYSCVRLHAYFLASKIFDKEERKKAHFTFWNIQHATKVLPSQKKAVSYPDSVFVLPSSLQLVTVASEICCSGLLDLFPVEFRALWENSKHECAWEHVCISGGFNTVRKVRLCGRSRLGTDKGTIHPFLCHAGPWSHIKLDTHTAVVLFTHAGIYTCSWMCRQIIIITPNVCLFFNLVLKFGRVSLFF